MHLNSHNTRRTAAKRIVVTKTSTYLTTNPNLVNLRSNQNEHKHSNKRFYLPFKGKLNALQLQVIASRVKSSRTNLTNSQPFFESQGKKSADAEFNLYLSLSKRFLTPYKVGLRNIVL